MEENKNGENSPQNSNDASKSTSYSSTSPIGSSSSPKDFNETTALIGCTNYLPPEKKRRCSGELTLKEIDTYVKTLYHAHKCLEEPPIAQREIIQRRQKDYFVSFLFSEFLSNKMPPVTSNTDISKYPFISKNMIWTRSFP